MATIKTIFPMHTISKISSALEMANGNTEEAVDLLLHGLLFNAIDVVISKLYLMYLIPCIFFNLGDNSEEVTVGIVNSLDDVLRLIRPTSGGAPRRLTVARDSIFEDSIAFFKERSFDFSKAIKITFEGEPAIDGGGPLREFFTILMRTLLSSTSIRLFEGRGSCFLPIHNTDALRSNLFKIAGRMVTSSIIHGGPGLPIFSHAVYLYFQHGNADEISQHISKDDVIDAEIIDTLTKVIKYIDYILYDIQSA